MIVFICKFSFIEIILLIIIMPWQHLKVAKAKFFVLFENAVAISHFMITKNLAFNINWKLKQHNILTTRVEYINILYFLQKHG